MSFVRKMESSTGPEKIHMPTLLTGGFGFTVLGVAHSMITPLYPFMVKSYMADLDETQISKYAGLIASFFFLGQIPGFLFWGWVADRFGRKPSLLYQSLGTIVMMILFGLSKNLWVGLAIRFLWGFFDCSLGVLKTLITELCNDKNISLGTGALFVGAGIGSITGPLLGAYLTKPEMIRSIIEKIPMLKNYPYLLLFSLASIVYVVFVLLLVFVAKETLPADAIKRKLELTKALKSRKDELLLKKNNMIHMDSTENLLLAMHDNAPSRLLKQSDVFWILFLYGLMCVVQISFDFLFSSYCSLAISLGGLGLDRIDISWILTVASTAQMGTVLVIPKWIRLGSYKQIMITSIVLHSLLIFAFPFVNVLLRSGVVVLTIGLAVTIGLVHLIRSFCFHASTVLLSNVSFVEFKAIVFGLAQFLGAVARCVGPLVFAVVFSWSISKNTQMINVTFSYILIGAISILSVACVYKLSEASNRSKGSMTISQIKRQMSKSLLANMGN